VVSPETHEQIIPVVAAALMRGGRLLAARRAPGGPRGGLWELPGGKVEPGESAQEALARELREELGVRVTVGPVLGEVVHAYPDLVIRLMVCPCSLEQEEPMKLEHDALAWLGPDDLWTLPWAAADRAVLGKIAVELWPQPCKGGGS